MTYLIGQIFVCLLIALILGLIIGWMLRASAAKQREAFLEEDLRVSHGRLGETEGELRRCKGRLDDVESERSEVSKRCVGLERTTAEQTDELELCRAEIIELNNNFNSKDQRVMVLEKESRYWQKQIPLLQSEINKSEAALSKLQKTLSTNEGELPELQSAVDAKVSELAQTTKELESLRKDFAGLNVKVQGSDKKIRSTELLLASQISKTESALQLNSNLQAELDALKSRAPSVAEPAPDDNSATEAGAEMAAEVSKKQKVIDELRRALEECQAARQQAVPEQAPLLGVESVESVESVEGIVADDGKATEEKLFSTRPDQVDDLKRIKGVGPKLEGMLNNMGIYQFEQIASFTLKDLAWVDNNLSAFKGRAKRDNWVAQASDLTNVL
ncbi:MAG: hypothetical protein AB8B86_05495 [Pseudomonadales bacterium]